MLYQTVLHQFDNGVLWDVWESVLTDKPRDHFNIACKHRHHLSGDRKFVVILWGFKKDQPNSLRIYRWRAIDDAKKLANATDGSLYIEGCFVGTLATSEPRPARDRK